jgi:cytochrome c oxidase cbb3-type subunit 1
MSQTNQQQPIEYNMKVVRQFTVVTIIWGIVGMALGVLIAAS